MVLVQLGRARHYYDIHILFFHRHAHDADAQDTQTATHHDLTEGERLLLHRRRLLLERPITEFTWLFESRQDVLDVIQTLPTVDDAVADDVPVRGRAEIPILTADVDFGGTLRCVLRTPTRGRTHTPTTVLVFFEEFVSILPDGVVAR